MRYNRIRLHQLWNTLNSILEMEMQNVFGLALLVVLDATLAEATTFGKSDFDL